MTAIDELRRMLDERGVEHEDIVDATLWKGSEGTAYTAAEVFTLDNMRPSTKKLVIRHVATPAQAIAATLGDADATGARHGVDPDPDRVRELLYSCESREELCARVAALEAVVGRVG